MSQTLQQKLHADHSVLLIEDELFNNSGLIEIIRNSAFLFEPVSCIEEALRYFESGKSADVVMISSKTAKGSNVNFIRTATSGSIYLIVIDFEDDPAVFSDQLGSGEIDCVLSKSCDIKILQAKVLYGANYCRLIRHQAEQRRILFEQWQHMDLEQEIAAKIYNNVLQSQFLKTDAVQFIMSPMALFNGDLLLVEKTPDNHLHFLLGDFTGHGLSASIAATPVADIFYGMTRKGFALRDILQEINNKLVRMLPANIFLAASAVALFPDSKILNVIACGLPDHFLVDHHSGNLQVIKSRNLPLGILSDHDLTEQNFLVGNTHYLYLLTDGIFEVVDRQGEMFGAERVVETLLAGDVDSNLENLEAAALAFNDGLSQRDDMSLVKLHCDVEHRSWEGDASVAQTIKKTPPLTWKSGFEFEIDVLRQMNPVPLMVNALMEVQGLTSHRQSIYMIVTELFANALDHGILQIDSSIKQNPVSFMRFYQVKEERLQNAESGLMRFSFVHRPTSDGGRLTIKVVDSGDGFDFRARSTVMSDNESLCGRGIQLIRSLCTGLTYHGKGNRATAVFEWRAD